jgi:hypothetical protein
MHINRELIQDAAMGVLLAVAGYVMLVMLTIIF